MNIEFKTTSQFSKSVTLYIDGVNSGLFNTEKLAKEYLEKNKKEVIVIDEAITASGVATQKIDEVKQKRRYLRKAGNDRSRNL